MAWKTEAQRKLAIKKGRLKLTDLVDPEILVTLPFIVPEPHELESSQRRVESGAHGAQSLLGEPGQNLTEEDVVAISVAVHTALKDGKNAAGVPSETGHLGAQGDMQQEAQRAAQPSTIEKERYSREF